MPENADHRTDTLPKAALLGLALLFMAGYAIFFMPAFVTPEPKPTPARQAAQAPEKYAPPAAPIPIPQHSGQFVLDNGQEQRKLLERLSADPALMGSTSFVGKNLSGLVMSGDLVIEKAIFHHSILQKMKISGITFCNCLFYDSDFSRSEFAGVIFEGCAFENTRMEYGKLSDTLFVDCRFVSNGPGKNPKTRPYCLYRL